MLTLPRAYRLCRLSLGAAGALGLLACWATRALGRLGTLRRLGGLGTLRAFFLYVFFRLLLGHLRISLCGRTARPSRSRLHCMRGARRRITAGGNEIHGKPSNGGGDAFYCHTFFSCRRWISRRMYQIAFSRS